MTIRIDGTNTTANPGITGGDADTGLQFGTDEVKIVTGGSDRVTVDNSGQVGIGITPAVDLDVSGEIRASSGILFGTDTAAANALDDYEEGTWTPVYDPQTGAFTSITYDSVVQGFYTKIGGLCYIRGFIRTDALNKTGASGNVQILGIPFTAKSGPGVNQTINIGNAGGFLGETPLSALITGLSINLYYRTTADDSTISLDVTDLNTSINQNGVFFSGVYEVA